MGNEILVVQCGIGHSGTGKTHRLHHSFRCQHTGSAHLDNNIFHHRRLDFGRILVGNRPLGEFGCSAEPGTGLQVIDFDHSAVNVAAELVSVLIDGHDIVRKAVLAPEATVRDNFQSQFRQIIQGLGVGLKLHALRKLDIKDQNIQTTLSGNFGIQLTQRACRGVSGVGEERLTFRFLLVIQPLKALLGHKDFATDDESGRCILQNHGNGMDGLQIFRHILAYIAITPGGTTDKHTVFIFQSNGKTVDLRFHRKFRLRCLGQNSIQEFFQFFH